MATAAQARSVKTPKPAVLIVVKGRDKGLDVEPAIDYVCLNGWALGAQQLCVAPQLTQTARGKDASKNRKP
jgi:hypothetical protein